MSYKPEYLVTSGKKYVVTIDSYDGFPLYMHHLLLQATEAGSRTWTQTSLTVFFETEKEMKDFEEAANKILNGTYDRYFDISHSMAKDAESKRARGFFEIQTEDGELILYFHDLNSSISGGGYATRLVLRWKVTDGYLPEQIATSWLKQNDH